MIILGYNSDICNNVYLHKTAELRLLFLVNTHILVKHYISGANTAFIPDLPAASQGFLSSLVL